MFQLKKSLIVSFDQMKEHTQELCQLDTGIGDGDHGITIERGFSAAKSAIEKYSGYSDAETILLIADAMINSMGGAIGPLYGTFWRAFSKAIGADSVSDTNIGIALFSGCEKVMELGSASIGEKTIVDAMYPCALAAIGSQGGIGIKLLAAAEAAMQGAINTKNYKAKKGRARFLGEQSIGHIDAGAYSFALFIGYWARNVLNIKGDET